MDDKNFITFIMACLVLFLALQFVFNPKDKTTPDGKQPIDGSTISRVDNVDGSTPKPTPPTDDGIPGDATVPVPPQKDPKEFKAVKTGKTVTMKTDVYEVEFQGRGAAPTSWKLLDYPKEVCFPRKIHFKFPPSIEKNPPCDVSPVDLLDHDATTERNDFISEVKVDGMKLPVNLIWNVDTEDVQLNDGQTVGEVVFSANLKDGRIVKKIFTFRKSNYDVDLHYKVENGKLPEMGSVHMALFYRWNKAGTQMAGPSNWNFKGPEANITSKKSLAKLDPDDIVDDGSDKREDVNWAAMTDEYFLRAIIAENGNTFIYRLQYSGSEENKKDKKAAKDINGWVLSTPSEDDLKQGYITRVKLYMGPKEKPILVAVDKSLEVSIDYGILKILVKPLLVALRYINKIVGNYGFSIMILTIILRMGMFPLTRKSQAAMKQMTKLQPEIKRIREEYPDDKMKQNEETQNLWRKHKINPAMGCLPILLQMPVFFAFYKSLLISIELRQAPFFAWIIDLSARDPLYVWPVAMGVTQLITQKLTPTQMDPTQAKMFLAMPIVFMFILRDFPSGLLVYWTVQNIVGILQQLYVNRQPD
jgi:YidC/Oxa1 family membrane protein insertase